jgi:hypothetical protein
MTVPAARQMQKIEQPQSSTAASPLHQPRSNTAAAQVGWNVPQAPTFERQHSNNKVMYEMVQSSNANTHAMATQMAASFAAAATASNAQAMQTVHSMQATHAASSGSLMNQMAESSRQALDQMKNVVSEVMHMRMQHAQPMHAPTLPLPPMPPPNWMMSGGSSGSGGQNPTPVQWTESGQVGNWAEPVQWTESGQVGMWAENPTADTDWPGWQVHQTWTPIVAPPTSAAEMQQPSWTWEEHRAEDEITSSSGSCAHFDLGQASAALAAASSDEEEMYVPVEENDQIRHQWGWQRPPEHKGLGHQNRLYRHTLFKL